MASRRGPLGPRLRKRAQLLAKQGLLPDGDSEEIVVIRGQPTAARSAPSVLEAPDA